MIATNASQVVYAGKEWGILSKTGMGNKVTKENLILAQGCTHGGFKLSLGPALGS